MNDAKMKPMLKDNVVYMGDNGRTFCGVHAGMTARYSGYDLHGMKCAPVPDKMFLCETCEARKRRGLPERA